MFEFPAVAPELPRGTLSRDKPLFAHGRGFNVGAYEMKTLMIAGAAAALLASSYAMAQDATLTIEPAHRTIIKQYVVKEHIRPMTVKESVAVGTVLPGDVSLQPVPEAWVTSAPEVQNYEYFDWNGKVVFVEPKTRKVVSIID
jgi:hypothetical protein